MRVLMFGWEFPPHISGGLGTACFELTQALARHPCEVVFVLPRLLGREHAGAVRLVSAADVPLNPPRAPIPPVPRRVARSRRLEYRIIDTILRPYMNRAEYRETLRRVQAAGEADSGGRPSVLAGSLPYAENLTAEVARYSEAAEALARTETFDVIHAHDWMTVPAGLAARRVSRKPLVVHIHATEFDRSGEAVNRAIFEIERAGLHVADHVVAVSHYTRNLLLNRYGVAPHKVSVIYNAVSRRNAPQVYHVRRDPRRKVVLFLGRVTFQKGPDYFVEAAARVLRERPDVTFVMAGSGDMLPRMVERVAKLRIGDRFHFTGFLQGEEVERMYALSDLYVMPSVSEPFGIAPLEAMLYDVPVILSTQSGVAEILTHALKVDFWDVQELAGKILAALSYPALTSELRRNARQEVRKLSWDAAAQSLLSLYHHLIA